MIKSEIDRLPQKCYICGADATGFEASGSDKTLERIFYYCGKHSSVYVLGYNKNQLSDEAARALA